MAMNDLSDDVLRETMNALRDAKGNQTTAAGALGIARGTLQNRERAAKARGIKAGAAVAKTDDPQVMKGTIRRLEAELKRHQKIGEQSDIVKGVIGTMTRRVEELDPPKWLITPNNKPSAPGVPTLFLSDLHWGERVYPSQINNVNEYSIKIAHERMARLVDSAVHLLEIVSPKMDYPGIVVPLGGDMISGNLHEELSATNEINSMPSVLDLYGVLVGVIKSLVDKFGAVFLPAVSGNHGRDTRKTWSKDRHHTSFDWLLYRFLAKHFEGDKRVTFFIPDGPDAFYKIFDHAYLLTHGDSFRGGDGVIGVMGPIIRGDHKKRSRNAQVGMEYDTMIMGHFHQYVHHSRFIINGSLKGYDEYAYANNFGFEPPQQALWITHKKYGQTFRMPVLVGVHAQPASGVWVKAFEVPSSK